MSSYSVILFCHVGSALTLAAALGMDRMLLAHLQKASNAHDAESFFGMWKAVPWTASLSLLVLLLTGGYLTGRLTQWPLAWPKAALVALLLIGALGGITSKRMRLARKACTGGASDSDCLRRVRDPMLKVSVNMRITLLFAAVLLMTTTPGGFAASAIVAGGALCGYLASLIESAPGTSSRAAETERP